MNDKVLRADRYISGFFLYLAVVFVPFATNMPDFLEGRKIFLALAVLFSGTYALYFLFQFAVVVLFMETLRYGINIVNGYETSFFSSYEVPVLLLFSFFTSSFCTCRRRNIYRLALLFCTECSILLVLFRNRFMLDMGVYRFIGIYANPNTCGWFCVCTCMMSLVLLSYKHRSRILKIISIINMLLSGCAVIRTYSRACLLALCIGSVIYIIIFVTKEKGKLRKNNTKMLLLLAIPMFLGGSFCNNVYSVSDVDMVNAVAVQQESGANIPTVSKASHNSTARKRFSLESEGIGSIAHNLRIQIWLTYVKKIKDYILIGTRDKVADRPMVHGAVRDTHNTYIQAFFWYGIGGGDFLSVSCNHHIIQAI